MRLRRRLRNRPPSAKCSSKTSTSSTITSTRLSSAAEMTIATKEDIRHRTEVVAAATEMTIEVDIIRIIRRVGTTTTTPATTIIIQEEAEAAGITAITSE